MVTGFVSAIGLILSSFTTSLWQLYITYGVITSISYWMIPLPALTIIGKYFKKRLLLASGIALAGSGAGQFIQSLLIQNLVDNYGWRGTLLILAGMSLNICVGGALYRPLVSSSKSANDVKYEKEETTCVCNDTEEVVIHSSSLLGIIALESQSNVGDAGFVLGQSSLSIATENDCTDLHYQTCVACVSETSVNDDESVQTPSTVGLPKDCSDQQCRVNNEPGSQTNCKDSDQVIVQSSGSQTFHTDGLTFQASSLSGSVSSNNDLKHLASDEDQHISKYDSENEFSDTQDVKGQVYIPDISFSVKDANFTDINEDQTVMVQQKQTEQRQQEKQNFLSNFSQCLVFGINKLRRLFRSMCDLSLFRIAVFVLMLGTAFCHSAGHYAILSHVVKRGQDFGISSVKSSSLPAVTGLTQCLGRLFWGILGAAIKKLTPQFLYAASMGVAGLITIISIYTDSYVGQLTYMILFGVCMACYIPMFPVVLRTYLGAEKLDQALSMFLQAQGVGAMVSAPFLGWLRDVQGHYIEGFYVVAVVFILSSVLAFLVPVADKHIDQKRKAVDNQTYGSA